MHYRYTLSPQQVQDAFCSVQQYCVVVVRWDIGDFKMIYRSLLSVPKAGPTRALLMPLHPNLRPAASREPERVCAFEVIQSSGDRQFFSHVAARNRQGLHGRSPPPSGSGCGFTLPRNDPCASSCRAETPTPGTSMQARYPFASCRYHP